jgi:aldose sugar dehydrogenase
VKKYIFFIFSLVFISTFSFGIELRYDIIYSGLNNPTAIQVLPDKSILVSEKKGRLKIITTHNTYIVYDLKTNIFTKGEGGIFDIKLDPNFNENKTIYFSYSGYTKPNSKRFFGLILAKAKLYKPVLGSHSNRYKISNIETLYTFDQRLRRKYSFGGTIFATTDYIFLAVGDRGYRNQSQSTNNTLGTLIRINKDGSIPRSNPFYFSRDKNKTIYSYGHRKIMGIAYDPFYDIFWAIEKYPNMTNELKIIDAGENYGWPILYSEKSLSEYDQSPFKKPYHTWINSMNPAGMLVYTKNRFHFMKGDLLIGSKENKHIRWIVIKNKKIIKEKILLKQLNKPISNLTQGPSGYIYAITSEPRNAKVVKIYLNK